MNSLTVITVTYNAEDTLERTLNSVYEQTYPHINHVIVDGKSNDGTVALLASYHNKWTQENQRGREANSFVWISEPDEGLYDAMNKAIRMATGHYLCFLNAGDTFYLPHTVEELMRSFDPTRSPDILYGETAIVNNDGRFLHMRRLHAPDTLTWKSFRNGMLVCHQAFIVKREMVEPYDLQYRFSSDFDWAIRMLKKASSIHNSRQVLINYLNEGITTRHRKASLKERYRIMVKHYGHGTTFFHHLWFVLRSVINPEKK